MKPLLEFLSVLLSLAVYDYGGFFVVEAVTCPALAANPSSELVRRMAWCLLRWSVFGAVLLLWC
jgi:hypothetical protein